MHLNLKTLVCFLIPVIMGLGSCSPQNRVVNNSLIQKRKHTGGFYLNLHWGAKKRISKKAVEQLAENREMPIFKKRPVVLSENGLNRPKELAVGPKATGDLEKIDNARAQWEVRFQGMEKTNPKIAAVNSVFLSKKSFPEEPIEKEKKKFSGKAILGFTLVLVSVGLLVLVLAGASPLFFLLGIPVTLLAGYFSFKAQELILKDRDEYNRLSLRLAQIGFVLALGIIGFRLLYGLYLLVDFLGNSIS